MPVTSTPPRVVAAAAFTLLSGLAAGQQLPAGVGRTQLLDNDTVTIARLRFAPGAREDVHTHPFAAIVVQIDAGDVEMRLGTAHSTGRREPGFVEFIPREAPHAAANAGAAPWDVVTIAIKPDRRRPPDAPGTAAPDGITRTPVLENEEARITRVRFAPSAREPLHTHPFDLIVVQLTPGRVELQLGNETSVREYTAGNAIFLPRDVPHAVSSVDRRPFEILSVGIR
jgi:quercetin dioxygenase-like cupin family protein